MPLQLAEHVAATRLHAHMRFRQFHLHVRKQSAVQMCSIAVKSMKPRERGAIVNIGSASATYLPSYPLYAVYAATKVSAGGQ